MFSNVTVDPLSTSTLTTRSLGSFLSNDVAIGKVAPFSEFRMLSRTLLLYNVKKFDLSLNLLSGNLFGLEYIFLIPYANAFFPKRYFLSALSQMQFHLRVFLDASSQSPIISWKFLGTENKILISIIKAKINNAKILQVSLPLLLTAKEIFDSFFSISFFFFLKIDLPIQNHLLHLWKYQ